MSLLVHSKLQSVLKPVRESKPLSENPRTPNPVFAHPTGCCDCGVLWRTLRMDVSGTWFCIKYTQKITELIQNYLFSAQRGEKSCNNLCLAALRPWHDQLCPLLCCRKNPPGNVSPVLPVLLRAAVPKFWVEKPISGSSCWSPQRCGPGIVHLHLL